MTWWISWNSSWLSKLLQSRTGCHIPLQTRLEFSSSWPLPFYLRAPDAPPRSPCPGGLNTRHGRSSSYGKATFILPCRFSPSACWQSCSFWPSRFCSKWQKVYNSFLDGYGRSLRSKHTNHTLFNWISFLGRLHSGFLKLCTLYIDN